MRLTTQFAAGALAAILAGGVAQAEVIYNFIPDPGSGGPLVQVADGQLKVTDTAYLAGSASAHYEAGVSPFQNHPGQSPILYAGLLMQAGDEDIGGPGVSPRSDNFFYKMYLRPFDADLTFNADGSLDGSLHITSTDARGSARGTGANWYVDGFDSDYFTTGLCNPGCDAGTGHWQVDTATIPGPVVDPAADVPEPATWGLFGLAMLGLLSLGGVRARR